MSAHDFLLGGAYLFFPSKVNLNFIEKKLLFWTKVKKFGFLLLQAEISKIVIFYKYWDNLKDIVSLNPLFSQAFCWENGIWGKEDLIVCTFISGSLAEATATSHKTLRSCVQTSGCTDAYVCIIFPWKGHKLNFLILTPDSIQQRWGLLLVLLVLKLKPCVLWCSHDVYKCINKGH